MISTQTKTEPAAAWDEGLLRNPHTVADKRGRVQRMFAAIAPSYDLNNRLHSLWMDQRWRRRAVRLARLKPSDWVVDVACGTGDLALKFAQRLWSINAWQQMRSGGQAGCDPTTPRVIGIDFTFEMLPLAAEKARRRRVFSPNCYDPRPPSAAWTTAWINGD